MQVSIWISLTALFFVFIFARVEVFSFELARKSGRKGHRVNVLTTTNTISGTSETTNPLSRLATSYNNKLEQFPNLTKLITSGIIAALGDVAVQYITRPPDAKIFIDKRRLIIFSLMGGLYIAPIISLWFQWLNSIKFPPYMTNTKLKRSLSMLLVDQTLGAVAVNLGFFFFYEVLSRAYHVPGAHLPTLSLIGAFIEATKTKMWPLLVANWSCWPLINFLNFFFIPLEYRLLMSNVASLFWNMILSTITSK